MDYEITVVSADSAKTNRLACRCLEAQPFTLHLDLVVVIRESDLLFLTADGLALRSKARLHKLRTRDLQISYAPNQ